MLKSPFFLLLSIISSFVKYSLQQAQLYLKERPINEADIDVQVHVHVYKNAHAHVMPHTIELRMCGFNVLLQSVLYNQGDTVIYTKVLIG